ncbi:hypothetical protein DM15PD_10230 [Aristophania vespae]|nr:hypothetical protein DM15PD_10230 [Aristophania vespae]
MNNKFKNIDFSFLANTKFKLNILFLIYFFIMIYIEFSKYETGYLYIHRAITLSFFAVSVFFDICFYEKIRKMVKAKYYYTISIYIYIISIIFAVLKDYTYILYFIINPPSFLWLFFIPLDSDPSRIALVIFIPVMWIYSFIVLPICLFKFRK